MEEEKRFRRAIKAGLMGIFLWILAGWTYSIEDQPIKTLCLASLILFAFAFSAVAVYRSKRWQNDKGQSR